MEFWAIRSLDWVRALNWFLVRVSLHRPGKYELVDQRGVFPAVEFGTHWEGISIQRMLYEIRHSTVIPFLTLHELNQLCSWLNAIATLQIEADPESREMLRKVASVVRNQS